MHTCVCSPASIAASSQCASPPSAHWYCTRSTTLQPVRVPAKSTVHRTAVTYFTGFFKNLNIHSSLLNQASAVIHRLASDSGTYPLTSPLLYTKATENTSRFPHPFLFSYHLLYFPAKPPCHNTGRFPPVLNFQLIYRSHLSHSAWISRANRSRSRFAPPSFLRITPTSR